MDEVFIQRVFLVDGHETACRFFKPVPDDHGDFGCRFEIDWSEGVQSTTTYGVDGVQALLLAMEIAHAYLLAARDRQGRDISFLSSEELGLPIAESIRNLGRSDESTG